MELVRVFKPAETAEERKAGGFILVDDNRIPDELLGDSEETMSTSSEGSSSDYGDDDRSRAADEFEEVESDREALFIRKSSARRSRQQVTG